MKFLFVGLGSIGERHLRNLHALGEREFVAYRTNPVVSPFEAEFGVRRVDSYEHALAQCPDAVFVTNPSAFHVRDALAAVAAGCHVFVEKPLGSSLEGVAELEALAREKRRVVYVGYHLRFHPILESIRELLGSGEFGKPIAAHLEVGQYLADWHPGEDPRTSYAARSDLGGGVILTLSHELDYASWLFGPARSVYCLGGRRSDLVVDVEDTADLLLEFASGVVATIHMDCLQRPPSRSLKVICEKGKIEWDYFATEARTYARERPTSPRRILLPAGFEKNDMYRREIEHFLDVIRGAAEPRVSLRSAIHCLQVALAARESIATKKPVDIRIAAEV